MVWESTASIDRVTLILKNEVVAGEGNKNFDTIKLTFWDIDFKLFIRKQD